MGSQGLLVKGAAGKSGVLGLGRWARRVARFQIPGFGSGPVKAGSVWSKRCAIRLVPWSPTVHTHHATAHAQLQSTLCSRLAWLSALSIRPRWTHAPLQVCATKLRVQLHLVPIIVHTKSWCHWSIELTAWLLAHLWQIGSPDIKVTVWANHGWAASAAPIARVLLTRGGDYLGWV